MFLFLAFKVMQTIVTIVPMTRYEDTLNIRCKDEDTATAFRKHAQEHDNQEEALRDLLPNIQDNSVELSGGRKH